MIRSETNEIINYLYAQYYLKDSTPEHFVSSHWKYYQNQMKVQIEDENIKFWAEAAFSDLQQKSVVKQVFSWLTIGSHLVKIPNRPEICQLMKHSLDLARRMGLPFTYAGFIQTCSLALVRQHLPGKKRINVIVIGDGYGFLSALIKEIYPDSRILSVDLGRVLLFQAYYCGKAHPDAKHYLVAPSAELAPNQLDYDFIYCPPEVLKLVDGISFDLAINIASMQEMNEETIAFYFDYLRQHLASQNLFYCCNREKKELFGGEVTEFLKYPWSEKDIHLVDNDCPWYTHFIAIYTLKRGPKLLNFRIPFVNYLDGAIRHRLTILNTKRKVTEEQTEQNA